MKNKLSIAGKVLHIAVLLAAVRCVMEPLRLERMQVQVSPVQLHMFLYGALLAGISGLIMSVLAYYRRYKLNAAIALTTIVGLVCIKLLF